MTEKRWYMLDEEGNVACFGLGDRPNSWPDESHLTIAYLTDPPFTLEDEGNAQLKQTMGPAKYFSILASHEIAKYVRENCVR